MKFKTAIWILIYFAIFAVGGYFLYTKYLNKFFNPVTTEDPKATDQPVIYYSYGNNLYRLDPNIATQGPEKALSLRSQSTGEVISLQVDDTNKLLFYDVLTSEKEKEIWQVNLNNNFSERLFSKKTAGLENFSNFRSPKVSQNNQKLAFLAETGGKDTIFIYDITQKTLVNLLYDKSPGALYDLSWQGNQILFFSGKGEKNFIKSIDLKKKINDFTESEAATFKNINVLSEIIIILKEEGETSNLLSQNLKTKEEKKITDLASPKGVQTYQVSQGESSLTFDILDRQSKMSDVYVSKMNGENLLQLTSDGNSSKPVFSPDAQKIAFWQKNSGIFTIMNNKQDLNKILNFQGTIDKIFIWR